MISDCLYAIPVPNVAHKFVFKLYVVDIFNVAIGSSYLRTAHNVLTSRIRLAQLVDYRCDNPKVMFVVFINNLYYKMGSNMATFLFDVGNNHHFLTWIREQFDYANS